MKGLRLKAVVFFVAGVAVYSLVVKLLPKTAEDKTTSGSEEKTGPIIMGTPAPVGSLFAAAGSCRVAVRHGPHAKCGDSKALASRLAKRWKLPRRDNPEADTPGLWIQEVETAKYPLPTAAELVHMAAGLDPGQRRALLASPRVTLLETRHPGGRRSLRWLRRLYEIAWEVAKACAGLILDVEAGEYYSLADWPRQVLGDWGAGWPDLSQQVTIFYRPDGESFVGISRGMQKFGLPEVTVNGIAPEQVRAMGSLLLVAMQTMAQNGTLARRGQLRLALDAIKNPTARAQFRAARHQNARGQVRVQLALAVAEATQTAPRLVEIAFPGPRHTLWRRQATAVEALFGSDEEIDDIVPDPELLAASDRARRRLFGTFKPKVIAGLEPRERLLVKAPFAIPEGGQEWMWIEVVAWEGRFIKGVLSNDPRFVPDLKTGAQVRVDETTLFDYIYQGPGGAEEGNETGKLIERQRGGDE